MQIKKKAYTAFVLAVAAVLTAFTASAQISETDCKMNYGVITFSGNTDAKGRVTYTAFKQNADDVLSIGEIATDEDGNFVIRTGFKASGDYVIKIKDANGSVFEKQINEYVCLSQRQSTLLNQINTGNDADIKTALDEINFTFTDYSWADITDTKLTSWLMKYIKEHRSYQNIDELNDEYLKLNALYIINKSKVASIADDVKTYASVLGIAENNHVKAFISNSKNAQKSALVTNLSSKNATTPQLLIDAIESANKTTTPPQGGSSSGGGGGGGGGTIAKIESPNVVTPSTQTPANDQKSEFSDLAQAQWAKEAVERLVEKKVISGYEDGTFRPNANVTREEFVKMVVTAFNIPYEGKNCSFLDVFENDWFRPYVGAAQECGIITGIADDIFGIHKEITRQDAAVILKRAADYAGISFENVRDYEQFSDHGNISDYAKDAVKTLYCNGTLNGRDGGFFAPGDKCTRAETAKMINGII